MFILKTYFFKNSSYYVKVTRKLVDQNILEVIKIKMCIKTFLLAYFVVQGIIRYFYINILSHIIY